MIFPRLAFAIMGAKDALTFRHDFFSGGIAFFVRVWLLILVYSSAFSGNRAVANLEGILAYLFLASAVAECTRIDLVDEVSQSVMRGTAALDLLRPISWTSRLFWSRLGERMVQVIGETLPGLIALAFLFRPQIAITSDNGLLGIASVVLGFWISFHVSLLFAILAMKLVQAWGVKLLESAVFMLFSGVLFPRELLPQPFAALTSLLPFQLAVRGPVEVFFGRGAGELLLIQVCWAVFLPLLVRPLFRRVCLQMAGFGG